MTQHLKLLSATQTSHTGVSEGLHPPPSLKLFGKKMGQAFGSHHTHGTSDKVGDSWLQPRQLWLLRLFGECTSRRNISTSLSTLLPLELWLPNKSDFHKNKFIYN